jgi:hypothetical protein
MGYWKGGFVVKEIFVPPLFSARSFFYIVIRRIFLHIRQDEGN